jgi:hypothetical protein
MERGGLESVNKQAAPSQSALIAVVLVLPANQARQNRPERIGTGGDALVGSPIYLGNLPGRMVGLQNTKSSPHSHGLGQLHEV